MKAAIESELYNLRQSARTIVRELGMLGDAHQAQALSNSQVHAMIDLEAEGLLSVNDIATRLCLEKSSVSRLLSRLLNRKLVKPAGDPDDRRKKMYQLTPPGQKLLGQVHADANARVQRAMTRLTPTERKRAIEGLTLYARALHESRL